MTFCFQLCLIPIEFYPSFYAKGINFQSQLLDQVWFVSATFHFHFRLNFRCPFPSFTISNNACKNQVWFVSVFYFIPIGVVFQSQKRCLIFGHLLKTICSKNLNSYNILSHIYWNVHYFLAIHLAILVLQELFIFSPRGQLRYLRLQVRVRVGPSLGRVAQIGIFDKSQLQESHFTLTTLIMHHMEHIQLLHLESKVRDILKMPRIFQIHGIFKIPGTFKQDIQRFLVYFDSSIF